MGLGSNYDRGRGVRAKAGRNKRENKWLPRAEHVRMMVEDLVELLPSEGWSMGSPPSRFGHAVRWDCHRLER